MKRIVFPLILSLFSFGAVASVIDVTSYVIKDPVQVQDSTDLFRNITDISRQIERHTNQPENTQTVSPEQPEVQTINVEPVAMPRINVNMYPAPQRRVFTSTEPPVPNVKHYLMINHLDSLYSRKENGTLELPLRYYDNNAMDGLTFRDTLFYSPLFLPMIFTGEILPRELSFYPMDEDKDKGLLIPLEKTFAPKLRHYDFVQDVRMNYYKTYPDKVKYTVEIFDTLPRMSGADDVVKETFNPFRELIKTETTYSLDAPGVEVATINRRYWIRNGEHSFQFAQNYFSDNWHRGGTNNLNFNSYQKFTANYNKDKVRFNNTLEWRLSVFNAPDDTLRRYRIGNDLVRYYGDFGVNAFTSKWSYSMNLEAKTQLFNAYPTNSNDLRSAFLAPLYVNAGVGLKYNLDKKSDKVRHRRVKLDLAIAPISINYKYVGNSSINVKRFGIPEGKKSLMDIGSTITSIFKYDITRYIAWDSRLTYFTSYEKVVSEFENSLNMALSNALSTRIYLNVRFDDGVPPDSKLKYWQYNQTLSFGLNYKW
ncbi:MAG: DUF3078 domain-containing protein [Proteiniphilum sp.]|jgi:hypothetical protein|uniref:DUF3078 domain-containing protein n=1 Tax=unclassified Proteiniphilum TaxID=2622718 RepID=UPI00257B371F|nr:MULTISPECIES: DUF3078 domain-containing protein [unclassified Proteiniphilum]MDD4416964.1 DUF3078 domain-containing protein [Proteiniphilum sp.]